MTARGLQLSSYDLKCLVCIAQRYPARYLIVVVHVFTRHTLVWKSFSLSGYIYGYVGDVDTDRREMLHDGT